MPAAKNKDDDPKVLLRKCVEEGRIDVLRAMLAQMEKDASFAATVDDPSTSSQGGLLHLACAKDDTDAARALLSSGANPCIQNDAGRTPLQLAKSEAMRAVFAEELLHAVAQSKLARVCQLLSAGVPIDSVDSPVSRNTPIHWAASFANDDVVRVLCAGGAKVNVQNAKNETPLHDAITRADAAIVKRLLQHGADATIKNSKDLDCFELASTKQPQLLQILSMSSVQQQQLKRTESNESIDRFSITSGDTLQTSITDTPSISTSNAYKPDRSLLRAGSVQIENWTDWLWPQPKVLQIDDSNKRHYMLPKDYKLKVYFDRLSECDPRDVMAVVNLCAPLVATVHLTIEYHRWYDNDVMRSPIEGVVVCSVWSASFTRPQSYRIDVLENRIDVCAADVDGMRNAWFTLTQIIRAHDNPSPIPPPAAALATTPEKATGISNGVSSPTTTSPPVSPISKDAPAIPRWRLPCLHILDAPDIPMRSLFVDFTGCRVFTVDTLCAIVSRLCLCKMTHLFVHFEVRPTDRFGLAYTGRDIFHLQRVCADLRVQLVPSLDLNSSYVDIQSAERILLQFLQSFPNSESVHFGGHLTEVALAHRQLIQMPVNQQRRLKLVYLSVDRQKLDEIKLYKKTVPHLKTPDCDKVQCPHCLKIRKLELCDLPPYCVLCVPATMYTMASSTSESEGPNAWLNLPAGQNICLRFTTSDVGYLCQAPESMVKNGILAAKLAERVNVSGTMICDMSTGCEIMPQSMAYMAEIAVLGPSWNRDTDMKKYCFLLPNITAEQIMLDRRMSAVFAQMLMLGYVEHELTRHSNGIIGIRNDGDTSRKVRALLSVFVQMILNPDNMTLERLTPQAFKRARLELRRTLASLAEVKQKLPYNYEMALTLGEAELVSELMVLAARIGQSLCLHGTKPTGTGETGSHVINVGVVNLPLAIRTDLANSLLVIRGKFQHTWLSRNLPSTLPNSLKIFDNLFKALLPPNMQEFGKNLL